jgi:tape measure domain-containing protein
MKSEFILTADDSDFEAAMTRAAQRLERLDNIAKKKGASISDVFKDMAPTFGPAIAAAGTAALALDAFKASMDMEDALTQFQVLMGDATKGTELFGKSKALAASTPFEFPEIANVTKSLIAFGFEAKNVINDVRMLGDVSSALDGKPIQEIAEIYGKAKVSGRIFAEDLNQFTGRGIPIIAELAKQFGVAESEVKKLVEAGKVGFPDIQKAFVSMTSEGGKFYGMMEKMSQTTSGKLSTLADELRDVKVEFAQEATPAVQGFMELLSGGFSHATDLLKLFKGEMAGLGAFFGTEGSLPEKIQAMRDAQWKGKQPEIKPQSKPYEEFKAPESKADEAQAKFDAMQKRMEDLLDEKKGEIALEKVKEDEKAALEAEKKAKADKVDMLKSELSTLKEQQSIVEETGRIDIRAKQTSLDLAVEKREQAEMELATIEKMIGEVKLLSKFSGRPDLLASEMKIKQITDQLKINRKEFEKLNQLDANGMLFFDEKQLRIARENADALNQAQRAARAFDAKEAQDPRNIRDAERQQRREEREGKAINEALKRREQAMKSDDDANRRRRGVGTKGEDLLKKLEAADAAKRQEANRKRDEAEKAKEAVENADKENSKKLEKIKENTEKTAKALERITAK